MLFIRVLAGSLCWRFLCGSPDGLRSESPLIWKTPATVLRDCTVLLHDLVIVVWRLAVMNILSKRVVVLCRALFRNWCQPMRRIEPHCWRSWSRRLALRQKGVPKAQVMIGSSLCAVFPLYIAFHASLLHAIDGVMSLTLYLHVVSQTPQHLNSFDWLHILPSAIPYFSQRLFYSTIYLLLLDVFGVVFFTWGSRKCQKCCDGSGIQSWSICLWELGQGTGP